MIFRRLIRLLLVPSTSLLLAACSMVTHVRPAAPGGEVAPPTRRTQEFYHWYIRHVELEGLPPTGEAYRQSLFLTEEGVSRLEQAVRASGRADPVLCASSRPIGLDFEDADIAGDTAQVTVRPLWDDTASPFVVHLRSEAGQWRITEIRCSSV